MLFRKINSAFRTAGKWFSYLWDEEAAYHSALHILGAISPLIIVGLMCIFLDKAKMYDFIREGDFCLFSAAILTPGAYGLGSYSKKNTHKKAIFTWPKFIATISWCIVFIAALLFSWIYIHSLYPEIAINEDLIVSCSTVFLIFSVCVFYYYRWLERELGSMDFGGSSSATFDDFEKNYN